MKHTRQVTASLAAIPRETLARKALKTVIGLLVIGLAVVFARVFGAPWYASVGTAMLGAHIISGELIGKSLRFLVAILRDLMAAIKPGATDDS